MKKLKKGTRVFYRYLNNKGIYLQGWAKIIKKISSIMYLVLDEKTKKEFSIAEDEIKKIEN